ncbi:MAG: hypothetical protein GX210_10355 [Firmicutes bacterium]|nr:hypothetical protein [Bacillota bacterium]
MGDRDYEFIDNAISDLYKTFGFTDEIPRDLTHLLYQKKVEECIKKIAEHMGLPVSIELSYVPKRYIKGNKQSFTTTSLSKTDECGRGIEEISAQVFIPEQLPSYGSSKLIDYPIKICVSENCHEKPETFITVITHELSHVLLKAVWHPQQNNEMFVDIVPLVFGFDNIIRFGRKDYYMEYLPDGTVRRHTITYGYLTDPLFDYALEKINEILRSFERQKHILIETVNNANLKCSIIKANINSFRDLLNDIRQYKRKRISTNDGKRLVKLFSLDYLDSYINTVNSSELVLSELEQYCKKAKSCNSIVSQRIQQHIERASSISIDLDKANRLLAEDIRVLKKNLRFTYKVRQLFVKP